jgi:hypothetical protein
MRSNTTRVSGVVNRGSVYPETFDAGYAKWKTAQAANQAFVCKSYVLACLAEATN